MSEWFKLIYLHYLIQKDVEDFWGVMDDVVGDDPSFYLFKKKSK